MTNDYAFPHDEKNDDGSHHFSHGGMTLRDYFAGQALMGFLADPTTNYDLKEILKAKKMTPSTFFAEQAYSYANAMLIERAKREKR